MGSLPVVLDLHLLGESRLGGAARRMERKMAGLLAYLALEGASPRTVLAGLLWPDVPEASARANLRQTLRRTREQAGAPVILGDDRLALASEVQVDAAALELAAFAGRDSEVVAAQGELLGGYDFDDCPEFMEWLVVQRERLAGLRREARARLGDACEARGEYREALLHAEKLLESDTVSEVAHRRVMRLHYLLGDRGAALRAFGRCQQVLRAELGASPMPETLVLAQQIEGQQPLLAAPAPARLSMPLSVQRPPRLIGREAEWNRLHAAWTAGQTVMISGAAGVGKTRLAQDFLETQGPYQLIEGHLGDNGVPYLSLMRAFRQQLQALPDLQVDDWVRLELARLLPELGTPAAPLQSQEDKLRFYEAQAQFMAAALRRLPPTLLIDDLHYHDEVSCEAWSYVLMHPAVQACGARAVFAFRQGELSAARLEAVQSAVAAGQIALIELAPLSPEGTAELLGSLTLKVPGNLAPALGRHTGGNPLFVLETLRSLIESGELEHANPDHLPLPRRLGPLVARRLERLSAAAGRLVSAVAVAGADFTPELAAAVLEWHPLDLAGPWAELEAAQVLNEQGFTHDLLAEAALANLPEPIRALLHRRVALHLEGQQAEPARVAHHWQAAGQAVQAAPWWLKAGQAALLRGADREAAAAFEQALAGLESSPDSEARLEALLGLGKALLSRDTEGSAQHLQRALREAQQGGRTQREIEAHATLAEWHLLRGELPDSHQAILQALQLVPAEVPEMQRQGVSELWRARFWVELRSGRLPEAETAISTAMQLAPAQPWLANERALLLWHAGRFLEAAELYEQLVRSPAHAANAEENLPWIANNMAWTYWALARYDEAAGMLQRSLETPSARFDRGLRLSNLSVILTSTGQYAAALGGLDEARTLLHGYQLNMIDVHYRTGVVHYRADQHVLALEHFREASTLARQVGDLYRLTYTLASTAALEAMLGNLERAQPQVAEASALAQRIQYPLATIIAEQAVSEVARAAGQHALALEHAQRSLNLAQHCQMPEQIGYGHLYAAQLPGPHVPAALHETLRIGQAYHLPDLTWRAAQALGQHELAQETLDILRRQSPPGWFPPQRI